MIYINHLICMIYDDMIYICLFNNKYLYDFASHDIANELLMQMLKNFDVSNHHQCNL